MLHVVQPFIVQIVDIHFYCINTKSLKYNLFQVKVKVDKDRFDIIELQTDICWANTTIYKAFQFYSVGAIPSFAPQLCKIKMRVS